MNADQHKPIRIDDYVVENKDVFRRAPKHELVGVVEGEKVQPMVSELATLGHDSHDIDVLSGEAGLRVLDPLGRHHGLRGRLLRGLQQLGSEEANIVAYASALRHGRSVIGVRTPKLDEALVTVFGRYGATDVVYYGEFTVWTLGDSSPDGGST